jgi:hypothetical protein
MYFLVDGLDFLALKTDIPFKFLIWLSGKLKKKNCENCGKLRQIAKNCENCEYQVFPLVSVTRAIKIPLKPKQKTLRVYSDAGEGGCGENWVFFEGPRGPSGPHFPFISPLLFLIF